MVRDRLVDIINYARQSFGNVDVLLDLCREIQLLIQEGEEDRFFRIMVTDNRGLK
jgi:hypothetical protein